MSLNEMRFIFSIILLAAAARAAIPPEQVEFFEKQVRPVLADQCYKCHGPDKQKADLRLDSREALLKGADTGPVVVPGDPDKSSLIKSIRHEGDMKMPEKAPKMPETQIAALSEWVKMGAPWPEATGNGSQKSELVKSHWAFQPISNPVPPTVKDEGKWASADFDRFVLVKLEEKGFSPSPIADRHTLIRRATFTLTGLPPTRREVEDFQNDPAGTREAFRKVVDRLLASSRYGERWGRHWLDVARYADHRGYLAGNDSREYPFAWTYRDWVIRAFNDDLPYDQFLTRQIAADLQGGDKDDLAALGFLTLGRRFLNDGNLIIDDRIDVTLRGTMALTVGCARCHDHKFDPISAKDYYALYGVFASCDEERDPGKLPELPGGKTTEAYRKVRDQRENEIKQFDQKVGSHIGAMWSLASGLPAVIPGEAVSVFGKARQLTRKYRDERRQLETKLAQAELNPGAPPRAHTLTDRAQPVTPRVFIRGNPGRPGEKVDRRFISFLGGEKNPFPANTSGRLQLAQAITAKENPLTARVIVNRVWAYHFGFGLVRTPGDFGAKGETPTHPELLDYLSTKLVADGWSLKKLHRTILLSSTWMQDSRLSNPKADVLNTSDPENRLLWRQNRQRLDWESLHDSLLAAAGELDEAMFGRPVQMFTAPFPKRRAIYAYIDRQNLPATLRTFDFASPDLMNPQRSVTSVPQQTLYMLNSPFVLSRATALVNGPEFASTAVEEAQVQQLYERVLSRQATTDEVSAAIEFVKSNAAPPAASPLWQYGHGNFDPASKRATFTPMPHWTGRSWQGGGDLPDPRLGWCLLNSDGGHPGRDIAAIRRFTAPRDMTVAVAGRVHRLAAEGNGVIARIISSRQGQIAEWVIEPKGVAASPVETIDLKSGETLDFLVESRGDDNSDSFQWRTLLRATDGTFYSAKDQFIGPEKSKTPTGPWEKYAQVLLQTNEFAFVD